MAENEPTEISDDEIIDEISDTPEYSTKSEFNKPKMIEAVMNRALELRARDMHPSYINTSISSDGTIKHEKIDDSREMYVNAVTAILCALAPEINRAKNKDRIDELKKHYDEIFDRYCYEDREYFATLLDSGKWQIKKTGIKFMPENDQIVGVDQIMPYKPGSIKGEVMRIKGYRNQETNAYWRECVKNADKIFCELQHVVDSLNYFKRAPSF